MDTIPVLKYLPSEQRVPDTQYKDALRKIYEQGRTVHPVHGEPAKMLSGVVNMHFPMANGFPLVTERNISGSFKGALAEHIAFLNGARTLEELRSFGCPDVFWARWVTEEKCAKFGLPAGDLGDASYYVWTHIPDRNGTPFNQVENVVRQIKEMPFLRTHRITPWYPPEVIGPKGTRKVVVAPCHGDLFIHVFPEEKELVVVHVQRSGDMPTGVPLNMIHYAAFGMMLAQVTGYTFTELIHQVVDAHIYERQYKDVESILERETFPFPTVVLDPSITNMFDFRREHFTLSDYAAGEKMIIDTPI